jgi:hypothetical protein
VRGDDYLFIKRDLQNAIENHKNKLLEKIEQIDKNRILSTNSDELADYFTSEFILEPPILIETNIQVSQEDVKIDVSDDYSRVVFDRSRAYFVNGTRFTYHIPFQGDANLFQYQTTTHSMNPPLGKVVHSDLQIAYEQTTPDPEKLKSQFNRDLQEIKRNLEWVIADVNPFNARLRETALAKINQRREKFTKDYNAATELGFPMRLRDDAPNTFVAPVVRKQFPMPEVKLGEGKPLGPTLDLKIYENILEIIQNMAQVIERSPSAFRKMNEEALRQHFLVQLNGQYEGQATGETFNYEGKTDILIRSGGRNIFIAECKFWAGSKSLSDAIDQILGYATWRDTKTAILVFNRTKNFSTVIAKISEVVKTHSNYVRDLPFESESGFRAVIRNRDDPERELTLTILAFDVPSE